MSTKGWVASVHPDPVKTENLPLESMIMQYDKGNYTTFYHGYQLVWSTKNIGLQYSEQHADKFNRR